jgi:bifunctional non-homologous end joining protein LigD
MFYRVSRDRRRQPPADFIEPCLPTLAPKPPTGPGWVHEIKHDGYRLMVRRGEAGIRIYTRNGYDWSYRYPLIVEAAHAVRVRSCTIDGEAVACDVNGLAVFKLLRRQKTPVHLMAFELLEIDGADVRDEPLGVRKATLAGLTREALPGLTYSEHLDEAGQHVFDHACLLGCEGIVSKRLNSRYHSGRTDQWIKTKNPDAPAVRRLEEEDWNT